MINGLFIFSGRIVVLREGGSNREIPDQEDNYNENNSSVATTAIVKSGCQWIHVAHDPVTPAEVIELLDFDKPLGNSGIGCVVIKFEPLVLHIQCRDLNSAKLVHTASVEAGFRNSGRKILDNYYRLSLFLLFHEKFATRKI